MSTTAQKSTAKAEPVEAVQDPAVDKAAYDEALSKARSDALATLREENRERFNALITDKMKTAGFDWKPRPTKAEKAEAELRRLLAENPELAAKAPEIAATVSTADQA